MLCGPRTGAQGEHIEQKRNKGTENKNKFSKIVIKIYFCESKYKSLIPF